MVVVPGRRLGDIVEAAVSKRRSCNNSARYPGEGEGGKEEERKKESERESVCSRRKEGRKDYLETRKRSSPYLRSSRFVEYGHRSLASSLSLSIAKREISKLFTYDQP